MSVTPFIQEKIVIDYKFAPEDQSDLTDREVGRISVKLFKYLSEAIDEMAISFQNLDNAELKDTRDFRVEDGERVGRSGLLTPQITLNQDAISDASLRELEEAIRIFAELEFGEESQMYGYNLRVECRRGFR